MVVLAFLGFFASGMLRAVAVVISMPGDGSSRFENRTSGDGSSTFENRTSKNRPRTFEIGATWSLGTVLLVTSRSDFFAEGILQRTLGCS
ncbi:MAG: hypothetical protein QM619_02450 [Micropruina sp.]|uniref:hypothetical protein n=1 Tax=Micropruina sp. TaxID=2737536 RepID=UPI0039E24D48